MKDFSLTIYKRLLRKLVQEQYVFVPINQLHDQIHKKTIYLRQDVDSNPENSVKFAEIQNELGIKSTFYIRLLPGKWNEKMVRHIAARGHEIGYHYENLTTSQGNTNGAIIDFENKLNKLRKLVPVDTICMHGSPLSKYDSKHLWKIYSFKDFGISAEPYFDINFSKMLYLTDTGRRWNGDKYSVRDKLDKAQVTHIHKASVDRARREIQDEHQIPDEFANWKMKPKLNSSMNMTKEAIDFQNQYNFRSTFDIIRAAEQGNLPDKIMMTFHPQRWTNKPLPWMKELIWQNTKNLAKYFLIKLRN